MKIQSLSIPLVLWLVLFGLAFILIQYFAWLVRSRPERFDHLQFCGSRLLGRPFSPIRLLIAGTFLFWIPSLCLLRLQSPVAWHCSFVVIGLPLLLALPCFFLGRFHAKTVCRLRLTQSNRPNIWTYSLGGILLATGAAAVPVFIYLFTREEEMLSATCPTLGFVGGTLLPALAGFITQLRNEQKDG